MSGTWIWPTCWEWISVWMGEPGCFKKFFNFVQICTWPFTKFLTKTVWIWTRPHLLLPRVLVYPLTWVCRQLPGEHVVLKSMWAESHVCFFCLLQCCGNQCFFLFLFKLFLWITNFSFITCFANYVTALKCWGCALESSLTLQHSYCQDLCTIHIEWLLITKSLMGYCLCICSCWSIPDLM